MSNINKICLIGRAGKEPEIRWFESGNVLSKLTLAVRRLNEEQPDWFNLEAWGKVAEIIGEFVKKGDSIGVEGELTVSSWTDEQTGQERSKPVIRVRRVDLLSGNSKSTSPQSEPEEVDF